MIITIKRVFIIVLDSVGIGEMPDAANYGDSGSHTLKACYDTGKLHVPNMQKLGLFNIDGIGCGEKTDAPLASFARMQEASSGKDTTIGHWEIAGIISPKPLPTYPEGFPKDFIEEFERKTRHKTLCNKPYSGTQVLMDYGEEHVKTGDLIVYTSADSVFQIAAHEDIVPVSKLYEYCQIARDLLIGEHGVGRVIARPFIGAYPEYKRTSNRHDFSLAPPKKTFLDCLQNAGLETIGVGKIYDIFAGKGISSSQRTANNDDGMEKTLAYAKNDFNGLCFINLVDFDMVYGHRNNVDGYTDALNRFDVQLGELLGLLKDEDVLMITADHGCDPVTPSTDHSREYTPLLVYGKKISEGVDLGTRKTFADIGITAADLLGVKANTDGQSLVPFIMKQENIIDEKALIREAFEARKMSYAPYSEYKVGAALLAKNGKIYRGCNIENASYSPSNCAERTAFFKAVSEGVLEFSAIAIVGAPNDAIPETFGQAFPCGTCRQVMMEFCNPHDFRIIVAKTENDYTSHTLRELLPNGFGPIDLDIKVNY